MVLFGCQGINQNRRNQTTGSKGFARFQPFIFGTQVLMQVILRTKKIRKSEQKMLFWTFMTLECFDNWMQKLDLIWYFSFKIVAKLIQAKLLVDKFWFSKKNVPCIKKLCALLSCQSRLILKSQFWPVITGYRWLENRTKLNQKRTDSAGNIIKFNQWFSLVW